MGTSRLPGRVQWEMTDIEGLARLVYWLDISINQGKTIYDWDSLSAGEKATWIEAAKSVERITS